MYAFVRCGQSSVSADLYCVEDILNIQTYIHVKDHLGAKNAEIDIFSKVAVALDHKIGAMKKIYIFNVYSSK